MGLAGMEKAMSEEAALYGDTNANMMESPEAHTSMLDA